MKTENGGGARSSGRPVMWAGAFALVVCFLIGAAWLATLQWVKWGQDAGERDEAWRAIEKSSKSVNERMDRLISRYDEVLDAQLEAYKGAGGCKGAGR